MLYFKFRLDLQEGEGLGEILGYFPFQMGAFLC